jgi:hypothetical protein
MYPVPYDLYVKYLITQDEENIIGKLREYGLAPVGLNYINEFKKKLKITLPTYIYDQMQAKRYIGASFIKEMDNIGLGEIWRTHPQFAADSERKLWIMVDDTLRDPLVRMTIFALLIKGGDLQDMIGAINSKFSTLLNVKHLEFIRRFFWNPQVMTRQAWRHLLSGSEMGLGSTETTTYFMALSEDANTLKSHLGLPSTISTSEVLQSLITHCHLKSKHYLQVADNSGNSEARQWISKTVSLLSQYEKVKSADLRDFSKELQMEFEFIDTNFDTPDEELLREAKEKGKKKDAADAEEEAEDKNPLGI